MAHSPGTRRFAESTRGRILTHLRRAPATVDELAHALKLTDNAVRAHLVTLERDGLIRTTGTRQDGGVGKPAVIYEASVEAESALSRAYVPLLRAVLGALSARLPRARRRTLLRDAGRRMATEHASAAGTLRARAEAGAALLNSLGGSATVSASEGGFTLCGCGCPASAAVAEHPDTCVAMETLLREVTGAGVRQHCEHGARPNCRFEIFSES